MPRPKLLFLSLAANVIGAIIVIYLLTVIYNFQSTNPPPTIGNSIPAKIESSGGSRTSNPNHPDPARTSTPRPNQNTEPLSAPPFVLTATDGSLTSSAIRSLDLTKDEALMLQESIVTCLKEFENNAAKNATYIKSESNPDSGIYVYRIPASKEAREVILKSFQSNLLRQLGKDKGNSIYGAFINDQTINDKLGGLAKYDTKIRFYPNDTGNANIVSLSYTDPESGKRVMSTSRTIESFKELFGDSFEFEKLKMNQ